MFLSIITAIILTIVTATVLITVITGVPSLPTYKKVIDEMLDLARIKKGDTFYDLGCGDGRVLIAAAKRGAICEGWELNPLFVLIARIKVYLSGLSKQVKIHWGDYFAADISSADIIFVFLITKQMPRLEKKLKKEMRANARLYSYIFRLPNITPFHETKSGIYAYRIKN